MKNPEMAEMLGMGGNVDPNGKTTDNTDTPLYLLIIISKRVSVRYCRHSDTHCHPG
jgi:hypothetical protein